MRKLRDLIVIRPGFVLLLSASVYFGSPSLLLPFLYAACIHEAGHVAAIIITGQKIQRFTLSAYGAELALESCNTNLMQDVVLCLAGPSVNLMVASVCGLLEKWPVFLAANLLLGCFNLLPVLPLDGGSAAEAVLSAFFSFETSQSWMRLISRIFAALLTLFGFGILLIDAGKPWLLLMGIWLLWRKD